MNSRKDPNTRKNELLEAAGDLFLEEGYEDTSVNSIVESIGVSKGTFYYYFDTKEDVIDALVEKISEPIYGKLDEIAAGDSLTALEKLNKIFKVSIQMKLGKKDQVREIFSLIYRPENLQLRDKIQKRTVEKSAETTREIIKQAVEEETLDTQFPEEVSRLIFWMGVELGEDMAVELLDPETGVQEELYLRSYRAYENAIERMLGAPEGSVDFLKEDDLQKFLSFLNKSEE